MLKIMFFFYKIKFTQRKNLIPNLKAQDTQVPVPSKAQFGSGFRHKGRDEKTKN